MSPGAQQATAENLEVAEQVGAPSVTFVDSVLEVETFIAKHI